MKLKESQTSADDASNNVDNDDLFYLVSCRQVEKRGEGERCKTSADHVKNKC